MSGLARTAWRKKGKDMASVFLFGMQEPFLFPQAEREMGLETVLPFGKGAKEKNPPVTALAWDAPCQPPLGEGAKGTAGWREAPGGYKNSLRDEP